MLEFVAGERIIECFSCFFTVGARGFFLFGGRTGGKGEDLWHSGPVELSPFSATTTLVVSEPP